MVEVEPITCWWRTTTSAIRTGEPFGLTLTCAVLETESTRIVPDFSKLEPQVVQLPPFEVLGGTHAGDLVTTGKRFFQYDYRLRLLAEDGFGADVAVPPLEISYRVESKVSGGESVQGRDQSYALPRTSIRLISLVPDDTMDIREAAGGAVYGDRVARVARQSVSHHRRRPVRARRSARVADVVRDAAPQDADQRSGAGPRRPTHDPRRRRRRAGRRAAGQPRRMDGGTGRPRPRRHCASPAALPPAAPSASGPSRASTSPPTASCSSAAASAARRRWCRGRSRPSPPPRWWLPDWPMRSAP